MKTIEFNNAFAALTDAGRPFPWLCKLFERFVSNESDNIPAACNIPPGLGKTSVVAVWLIALATRPGRLPRRLVYVVNRRTVVDQTTEEVVKYHRRMVELDDLKPMKQKLGLLAISTLRGQFADNREWSADPSRPAVIVGTVDMIGSRLLFSGYGVGFKGKPLHAGFLGQDVLLVHDEAHLEPAFQKLLIAIQEEQGRCKEFRSFRVMELSATSRGSEKPLELTEEEKHPPDVIPKLPTKPVHVVWRRLKAKKSIRFHENIEEAKLADEISNLALEKFKDSKRAILVFLRKVDDVEKVVARLRKAKQKVQQLTGTLRGLERDKLAAQDPIFRRFLPKAEPGDETVYLVCTSAGEVGVNISADHLVCDLSTFDSMAQRFGRVNRFGDRDDTEIHVVYPNKFDEKDESDQRRKKTLELLRALNGDGSPRSLDDLDPEARRAAFAAPPTILPVSDILFDSWALTTIRGKLPGRPPVEPYLHGISGWEPPETHVAWREEVGVITGELLKLYKPDDLLEDYPLKPHELLRDNSSRVFDRLRKFKAEVATPVWIVADDDSVQVTSFGELIDSGKDAINYKTVVLPPHAGGLDNGLLTAGSTTANDYDVADEWRDDQGERRRIRVWDGDPQFDEKTKGMRLIRRIKLEADEEDEEAEGRSWLWFERPGNADNEGSKSAQKPVAWQVHTDDVTKNATQFVEALKLPKELQEAIKLAAKFHDLGKQRERWQRGIGNDEYPVKVLAKSGGKMKPRELGDTYRHEFGSLVDVLDPMKRHFAEFQKLSDDMKEVALHLIGVHHGRGRPHFCPDEAFDPEANGIRANEIAADVARRFARLQRKYGRWGLAYLESLLRAADYAASADPSAFVEDDS